MKVIKSSFIALHGHQDLNYDVDIQGCNAIQIQGKLKKKKKNHKVRLAQNVIDTSLLKEPQMQFCRV